MALACDGDRAREPRTGFANEPVVAPGPRAVLKTDTLRAPGGGRWFAYDLLLPPNASEAQARATLQHQIDSVAAADTLAVAVRVTGFMMGPVDLATRSASIDPALTALWGPPDSVYTVGARRRSYRTTFTILKPFNAGGPPR